MNATQDEDHRSSGQHGAAAILSRAARKTHPQASHAILGEHVAVQIAKRSELHTFKVMSKRWEVERSFAWLEKNRRPWKNCERWLNTSLQFVHLAFLALLLRRS